MTSSRLRVAFKTLGCRLNQAETATIAAQFEASGYEVVPFGARCDVAVVHGCTVTSSAEKNSLRTARAARNAKGSPFVILAGCPAAVPASGAKGGRSGASSCADLLAPQDVKFSLPGILHSRFSIGDKPVPTHGPVVPRFTTVRARVKVQDGCDSGCAYCIVPAARGASVSLPFRRIVDEAAALGDAGFKEVILTGANLGTYRDGRKRLVHLLEAIHGIVTIERIRLSSIEPETGERAVIDFMADAPKVCRYLHIPLQTGDDRLLAAMGRHYTVASFRGVIDHAVDRLGFVGLGTDLIAGLPGEDEAAFESTCRVVSDVSFSNLHVFRYSRRPGTKAAEMTGQVSETVKGERARMLQKLGSTSAQSFMRRCVGREVSVMIEKTEGPNRGTGWTAEYIRARVTGPGIERRKIATGLAVGIEKGLLQVRTTALSRQ